MDMTEKMLDRKVYFTGKIITLEHDTVQLPNGDITMREVARHPHGVVVAALDDSDRLLFVRQFRYPYLSVITELPAGKVDAGEDYLVAAKRELMEETGCEGRDWTDLGVFYPSPGFTDEVLHMYFCRVDSVGEPQPDEDEFVESFTMTLNEAVDAVMNGSIETGSAQALILKLFKLRTDGVI